MASFTIRPLRQADRAWARCFVAERWRSEVVVAHGAVYRPSELPGFVAEEGGGPLGLVTYHTSGDGCEIVTLDSVRPGVGIGTGLIQAVTQVARAAGCRRVWLITTNDNLEALRFYQKRGFVLAAVHPNAVAAARRLKPEISLVGAHGIPIRDEIELELLLP